MGMVKPVTTVQDSAPAFANSKTVDVFVDGPERFNIYNITGKF